MSTENITAFFDKARTDEALAARINAISAEANSAAAEALVALSREIGSPITVEDLLQEQETALSDASLAGVSGGVAGGENTSIIGYFHNFFGKPMPVERHPSK